MDKLFYVCIIIIQERSRYSAVKNGEAANLSIENPQKVMIFGQSKDLGMCKSTKKNGHPCTSFVNTNRCEFCIYHIKQEYQKCSRRSELQANFNGRGLTALRNKVLGKNEVFYAGKSYMAIPAKRSTKQVAEDKTRLKSLSGLNSNSNIIRKSSSLNVRKQATRLDTSVNQRLKDLELLHKLSLQSKLHLNLHGDTTFRANTSSSVNTEESQSRVLTITNKRKSKIIQTALQESIGSDISTDEIKNVVERNQLDNNEKIQGTTSELLANLDDNKGASQLLPADLIYEKNKQANSSSSSQSCIDTPENTSVVMGFPTIMALGTNEIDLNVSFSMKQKARAKSNAVSWVQRNGPIKKIDPNNTKRIGEKRSCESSESQPHKKTKLQNNDYFTERFQKIMAASSTHQYLLEQHDNEQQEKYFNKLEMKERMEEKMISTFKIPCKAVRCLQCKYTSFSASHVCKSEKHPLRVFNAFKRFFNCGDCGNRTVVLTVVPTVSCTNCGSGKWEKTGMMKEHKRDIVAHNLSIRGGEQKFVNSGINNANLNLMVPDS